MVTRASNGGGGEEFGLQGRSTRRDEASTVLALSAGFGARAKASLVGRGAEADKCEDVSEDALDPILER